MSRKEITKIYTRNYMKPVVLEFQLRAPNKPRHCKRFSGKDHPSSPNC